MCLICAPLYSLERDAEGSARLKRNRPLHSAIFPKLASSQLCTAISNAKRPATAPMDRSACSNPMALASAASARSSALHYLAFALACPPLCRCLAPTGLHCADSSFGGMPRPAALVSGTNRGSTAPLLRLPRSIDAATSHGQLLTVRTLQS
jgi:hypothetical protein